MNRAVDEFTRVYSVSCYGTAFFERAIGRFLSSRDAWYEEATREKENGGGHEDIENNRPSFGVSFFGGTRARRRRGERERGEGGGGRKKGEGKERNSLVLISMGH